MRDRKKCCEALDLPVGAGPYVGKNFYNASTPSLLLVGESHYHQPPPLQFFPWLRALLIITFCVWAYLPVHGDGRSGQTVPTLKPFGEFAWGDGIPATLEKLSHIRSLDRLSVFLGQRELKATPPTNSTEVAALLYRIPAIIRIRESDVTSVGGILWVDMLMGKETIRFVTAPATITASPVLIDGIPFSVTCEFGAHPAIILRDADQVFKDPIQRTTFAYTLAAVTVRSTSNQLPEHFLSLNKSLVDKYGQHYYPQGPDYPQSGGKRNFEEDLARTGFARVDAKLSRVEIEAHPTGYSIKYTYGWEPALNEILRKYLAAIEKDAVKSPEDMKKDL